MLLFSTVLDINSKMSRDKFMELIVEWNATTKYEENRIPDLVWNNEKSHRWGTEDLWLAVEDYPKQSTVAVRYEKRQENGTVWDTDYVMNFRNMKLAIRLDRSYTEDALLSDGTFSAPHFITLLIEKGYLKNDGELPITLTPIFIAEDNLELVANVINGTAHYKYPVVFVSKTGYNEDPVDVEALAKRLKGIAHVLVQEDKSTGMKLKELCNSQNEYYGRVGIYFPNQIIPKKRFTYKRDSGFDAFMLERIIQSVLQYCNAQRVDTLFTWQGVNNALLLDRVNLQSQERQKAETAWKEAEKRASELSETLNDGEARIRQEAYREAKAEVDELLQMFDEDMNKLKEQVAALSNANEALRYENDGLRSKLANSDNLPLIFYGSEHDFYQGEIKDLVLSTLTDALQNIPQQSRRRDVVEDIINNNGYQKLSEARAEEIKRMLKTYDGMSSKLRQDLESYGFEVNEDGKHYKILYNGDGRYTIVLSKTPSDWRTGKSSAQNLINIAF